MRPAPLALALLAACGSSESPIAPDAGDPTTEPDASTVTECVAPDVLVVLDRTMSMSRKPDGTAAADTPAGHLESKWYIAITAIEALSAQLGNTVQLGLSLFPRDPGGDVCVTLSQRLSGMPATNPNCEGGEVIVAPALSTMAAIDAALDPESTLLCRSTPIGAALDTARTALAAVHDPAREQYVMFVGDGRDTCDAGLVLTNTDTLAAAGVDTFVIAFDGSGTGIDHGLLNDMACAGHTAIGFPAPCVDDGNGVYRASDRSGPALYIAANDTATLDSALQGVASEVCCGCLL